MEENNKVIVFEKKEIVLVLILVVVLIVTSFTIGIRLGKKLSLVEADIKPVDQKVVELKSGAEEDAQKTVEDEAKLTDEEKLTKLMDESKTRLSDELEKFSTPEQTDAVQSTEPKMSSSVNAKYTIQLGSYPTIEEAKQFAEGFTVRGYSPIINQTTIEGKGTWFRVSLGQFGTVEEAKGYIKTEQTLFTGQDYVITEIK